MNSPAMIQKMTEFVPPNAERLVMVKASDIKMGMYMSFPDRPCVETRFLFQGILLHSAKRRFTVAAILGLVFFIGFFLLVLANT